MLYRGKSWAENNLGSLWTMRIVEFSESLETKEDDKGQLVLGSQMNDQSSRILSSACGHLAYLWSLPVVI